MILDSARSGIAQHYVFCAFDILLFHHVLLRVPLLLGALGKAEIFPTTLVTCKLLEPALVNFRDR